MTDSRDSDPRQFDALDEPDGARTERAARIREARGEGPGLVGRLPGMVYQCRNDRRWTMEFVSGGCRELTGYGPDDLLGEDGVSFSEIIHPDDRERVWDEVQAAIRRGAGTFELRYRIRTAGGDDRWVWEVGHPIRDTGGDLLALEGFILDVSERKVLEEELREAQKREAMAELTGAIAHDFNNLLTGILGAVELAQAEVDPESEAGRNLALARGTAERGRSLTRQLLTFTRRRRSRPRTLDLNAVVGEMVPLLDQLVGSQIEIRVKTAGGPLPVHMDPSHPEQILMNLVLNARDAMPSGGAIDIRTALEEDEEEEHRESRVVLEVSDSGTGMAPGTRARIFDPFFTTKGTGTGLGLSTVRRIVEEVGGAIEVRSSRGTGSRFRVGLPRSRRAVGPTPQDAASDPGRPPPGRRGEKIAVVEDDGAIRRLMRTALVRHGYDVVAVRTPSALDDHLASAEAPPMLLLVDYSLPERNGVEVASDFLERVPDAAVIFVTGYASDEMTGGGDALSAHGFLEKPFSIGELLEAVGGVLASRDRNRGDDGEAGSVF